MVETLVPNLTRERRDLTRTVLDPSGVVLGNLCQGVKVGRLRVVLPSGATIDSGEPCETDGRRDVVLRLNRYRGLRRLLLGGGMGFAESFIDGDWEVSDLPGLFELVLRNEQWLRHSLGGVAPLRLIDRLIHVMRPNSRRGSRRNIAAHYDLGNAFYRLWLDDELNYSSGLYATGSEDLGQAQAAKHRLLTDLLDLQPGQDLLEIGCGWGAFALLAAQQFGCRVTGLTLSAEQATFARSRVAELGLQDLVDIRLQDYRDSHGVYDRIASVEMFEAVGEVYWPTYFATLRDRLRPGGIAVLQVITIAAERFARYRRGADFIQRYIFPGGMLPTESVLESGCARAGLQVTNRITFGASYARTLAEWRRRFVAAWPAIETLGFDGRFRRMWEYYLAYCEAGFSAGSIDVGQYRIERRT